MCSCSPGSRGCAELFLAGPGVLSPDPRSGTARLVLTDLLGV